MQSGTTVNFQGGNGAAGPRTGSGQRKKVQSYSNFLVNQQKIGSNQFKPASRERQDYANNGQPNGQVSQSQRAQSTGNRKNQTVQNVNLSQSQRLNMS